MLVSVLPSSIQGGCWREGHRGEVEAWKRSFGVKSSETAQGRLRKISHEHLERRFCKTRHAEARVRRAEVHMKWRCQLSSHPQRSWEGRDGRDRWHGAGGKQFWKEGTSLGGVIYDPTANWRDTQPGSPWGSVPGLVQLKIFFLIITCMNRIENLLLTAANDTKPGGTSSTWEDGLELQNNLDTLEKQPGKKK